MRQECPGFLFFFLGGGGEANIPVGAVSRGETSKCPGWEGAGGAEMERSKDKEHSARPTGTCRGNEHYSV